MKCCDTNFQLSLGRRADVFTLFLFLFIFFVGHKKYCFFFASDAFDNFRISITLVKQANFPAFTAGWHWLRKQFFTHDNNKFVVGEKVEFKLFSYFRFNYVTPCVQLSPPSREDTNRHVLY